MVLAPSWLFSLAFLWFCFLSLSFGGLSMPGWLSQIATIPLKMYFHQVIKKFTAAVIYSFNTVPSPLPPQFPFKSDCNLHPFWQNMNANIINNKIIKITISLIVIGLKNSYFPSIHLPSCNWTVPWASHVKSFSLNQPITFKVVVTYVCAYVFALVFFGT